MVEGSGAGVVACDRCRLDVVLVSAREARLRSAGS
jgi:hypothetical protein